MAMLETVLNPTGERYYSFGSSWSETEEIASMRNGSGDEFDIGAVQHVYAGRPLSQQVVSALNAEVSVAELADAASRIGYPLVADPAT
ncbi:hypothetical protein GCM10009760_34180 [Kitasatospora kazusensis]|uniref:Uncharacterized protein n=1 Tax=Kitasatospora kazusensis TaxID=407974 RepID=A0ABP5LGK5_9ACTN